MFLLLLVVLFDDDGRRVGMRVVVEFMVVLILITVMALVVGVWLELDERVRELRQDVTVLYWYMPRG